MTSSQEIDVLRAEVTYYRESVSLQRARLYRRGLNDSPRLTELERKLESAERRLRIATEAAKQAP